MWKTLNNRARCSVWECLTPCLWMSSLTCLSLPLGVFISLTLLVSVLTHKAYFKFHHLIKGIQCSCWMTHFTVTHTHTHKHCYFSIFLFHNQWNSPVRFEFFAKNLPSVADHQQSNEKKRLSLQFLNLIKKPACMLNNNTLNVPTLLVCSTYNFNMFNTNWLWTHSDKAELLLINLSNWSNQTFLALSSWP